MKYPSHIYTVFHTLKVKDSSEPYVRLFRAGVFIGRPQLSFVLRTICYTTHQANHKDFKTAWQSSAVTWTESRPMCAKLQESKQAPPVLGTDKQGIKNPIIS